MQHGALLMSPNRRKNRTSTRGIGLLELMIGLVLAPIILAGVHSSFRAQIHSLQAQNSAFALQDLARGAVDLIVREIRMAGYDPSGGGLPSAPGPACPGVSQGITEATPTRLHILADLDGNGGVTGPNEDVIYEHDMLLERIVRIEGGNTIVLAENVPTDGLAFSYFDMSDPPIEFVQPLSAGDLDCIGTVDVAVRLAISNPNPSITSNLTSQATSQVAVRSRALTNF
jgi:type IV pilus assembly protein PilW